MSIGQPVGTVGALWRFPVKSMLGEEIDQADADEGGIVGDRAFALVRNERISLVAGLGARMSRRRRCGLNSPTVPRL